MTTVATKKDMQAVLDEHYVGARDSSASIDGDPANPPMGRPTKKASIFKAFITGPAQESPNMNAERKDVSRTSFFILTFNNYPIHSAKTVLFTFRRDLA